MEIIKINQVDYKRICQMFDSPDSKNHVMGIELVSNLDPNENIVYILALYYKYRLIHTQDWDVILRKATEAHPDNFDYVEELFDKRYSSTTMFSNLYNYIKSKYPEQLPFIVEVWKEMVRPFLTKYCLGLFIEILDQLEVKPELTLKTV
jgi:hypothetical protein